MGPLIDFFQRNFMLVAIAGVWLLSVFGNVLTKAAKKAAEQKRRRVQGQASPPAQQRRPLPGQGPPPRGQPRAAGARQRSPAPATPATPTRPARPTAEDIAVEIRRVMGMEEPPQGALAQEPPPPAPDEAGFEHFAEGVGDLHTGVKSQVGEGVSTRHTPASGSVGSRKLGTLGSRELGTLGGRVRRRPKKKVVKRTKRFDLSDPAAVLVTLEILGKPRALRDFEF